MQQQRDENAAGPREKLGDNRRRRPMFSSSWPAVSLPPFWFSSLLPAWLQLHTNMILYPRLLQYRTEGCGVVTARRRSGKATARFA